jgi:parallel beta-helix repeat protein
MRNKLGGLSFIIFLILMVNIISPGLISTFGSYTKGIKKEQVNTVNNNDEKFVIIEKDINYYESIDSFTDIETEYEYDDSVLLKINVPTLESLKNRGIRIRDIPKRTTIYLNDYVFDFRQEEPAIPEDLKTDPYTFDSHRTFIVHFVGPIPNEWIDALKSTGATLINYVPNFAYQVMMTPKQKAEVESLPFIDWVGDYHPAYKISPELDSKNISISLIKSPTTSETISAISQNIKIHSNMITPEGYNLICESTNRSTIETIAKMEDVRHIGPFNELKLMDEVGMQITGGIWDPGNPSVPYRITGDYGAYVNHLGYTGEGVTIAIADSGIGDGTIGDAGHPDFTGRIIGGVCYDGGGWDGGVLSDGDSWSDGYGHGTHVTGLVGANGYAGTGVIYDGHGPYYAGMGLAYSANFYSQKIFDDSAKWIGPENFSEIPRDAYRAGAVITQNSWGESPGNGAYIIINEAYDRATRDADPVLDGNQELTQVFSAGNSGSSQNTIGSPSSGKNVICVGSVRNYMPDSTSYGDSYGGGTGPDSVSSFSSRGWTDDNRIKPDVMAPGQAALSTRPPTGPTGHGVYSEDDRYMWSTGTSMSAPTATGAVAVLYEWYKVTYDKEPSPSVLKALLINSAVDIGAPDIPNKEEGWGRIYIPNIIDPPADLQIHDQEHELTTGVIDEFRVMYDESSEPLKITLVYTDKYALDGDSITLKNQVNLEVISPSGDIYHGNAFINGWTQANNNPNVEFDTDQDGYDDRNNVESVYIPPQALQSGAYTVRIIGSNIVADADNDGLNDQDYSLVMFNAIESVPWPYDWISLGTDSAGDGTLVDSTLNITEIKTAYNSDYLFIRLLVEGVILDLTDNSWWVYIDMNSDGQNDWLVEERPSVSGGIHGYYWNSTNGNWALKITSTNSDMDNDSAVRNITSNGYGCIDFALKSDNYPGLNINNYVITAASDEQEDLNLSGDINRNPTDTSDPSSTDVAEFIDSVGPLSFINDPPSISTTDIVIIYEDDLYFVNYEAFDPQGDSLRWSLQTNASFLSLGKVSGFLKGVPTNKDVGVFWINVTVTDFGGLQDFHNFTLIVFNTHPIIMTENVVYAITGIHYSVDYSSNDDGQGLINWNLVTNATWLSINNSNGLLTGNPTIVDLGFYWVNVTVFDGNGGSDFQNFTLTVLLSHSVIRINSNTDFANQALVESWKGSGTSGDPYIIEGYGIDASDTGPAIYVGNTTVYFKIRRNYLYNTSEISKPYFRGAGVQFYNVIHGVIRNNTITDNKHGVYIEQSINSENSIIYNSISTSTRYGIELQDSGSIIITYNVISRCYLSGIATYNNGNSSIMNNIILNNYHDGIRIFENSNNNKIYNNSIFDQATGGILIQQSNYNEIVNNTVSYTDEEGIRVYYHAHSNIIKDNNISGISLSESHDNVLANNTVDKGIYIEGDQLIHWNTHTIDISNQVRGRPFFYWKNRNGGSIPLGAGGVILANCNDIIVENQNIKSGYFGIEIGFCSDTTIINNTITKNKFQGIFSYSSMGTSIINNTILNNKEVGIRIEDPSQTSGNNVITNNIISENIGGISIFQSSLSTILNNKVNDNNPGTGITIKLADNNYIAHNDISNNKNGIYIIKSNQNIIENNSIEDNEEWDYGMHISNSLSNTLVNNTLVHNAIFFQGIGLEYWETHSIDTSNTVNGKPVYFWKNRNGGNVPSGAGEVILVNSANVLVENQLITDGSKLIISYSSSNIIMNNTVSNNYHGIYLYLSANNNMFINNTIKSNTHGVKFGGSNTGNIFRNNNVLFNEEGLGVKGSDNIISDNYISQNGQGIILSNTDGNTVFNNIILNNYYGVFVPGSNADNNLIYHNNFINNTHHAIDTGQNNMWNTVYPTGGNYWSDYSGIDLLQGPNQDQPGIDGIGDTNYSIDSNSIDNYPLMRPIEYYFNLLPGWNLISIPFIQSIEDLDAVLETIEGDYNAVQWYDAVDLVDPWKDYKVGKFSGNDLFKINETMGIWINIINPDGSILMASGVKPSISQQIILRPGWNLVGYPSLIDLHTVASALAGINYNKIDYYDADSDMFITLEETDYMMRGRGYWIHCPGTMDQIWNVPI